MHGRPTCSECTKKLQGRRGCRKPGFDMQQTGDPFVYTSPILQDPEDRRVVKECPVGMILRETPWLYDTIDACSYAGNATPAEMTRAPRYTQHATRLYNSEQSRLRELERSQNQARGDAEYGRRLAQP